MNYLEFLLPGNSGVGKTTLDGLDRCAPQQGLIAAIQSRPDYIDPTYHTLAPEDVPEYRHLMVRPTAPLRFTPRPSKLPTLP
jgi:hypothetical protein